MEQEQKGLPQHSGEEQPNGEGKKGLTKERLRAVLAFLRKHRLPVAIGLFALMLLIALALFAGALSSGGKAVAAAFGTAKQTAQEETYSGFYEAGYAYAEEKYHVSNAVAISIAGVRERANLEVLNVSDVAFIVEDGQKGKEKSWLEVPGAAVFTVDLTAGEYLVDDARRHVTVRVPNPELSNLRIDYENVVHWLYKNNEVFSNGSIKAGEDLARKQLNEAYQDLTKEIKGNQDFYLNAKSSAEALIKSLILGLNPEVTDLQIDIEFID